MNRKQAISFGLPLYNTKLPCKNNHFSDRKTSNSTCLECEKEAIARYRSTSLYKETKKSLYQRNPAKAMFYRTKSRANKMKILFDVSLKDVESLWKEGMLCPVLGIPLVVSDQYIGDNSPTLDKIVPSKGYTKDNIIIMSAKANMMKGQSATPQELRKLADWLESKS